MVADMRTGTALPKKSRDPGAPSRRGKRILFLTPQLPYPPQQGTALRNYNLIAQVAQRHEVHLLSFAESSSETSDLGTLYPLSGLGPLRDLCASVHTVPVPQRSPWRRLQTLLTSPLPDIIHRLHSPLFYPELDQIMQDSAPLDVVEIEGLEMAEYGLHALRTAAEPKPRLVYDAHNAEYLLQKRIFEADVRHPRRWLGALYSWIQWQKLRRYEARVCRQAQRVIACSPADGNALAQLVPDLKATIIPNGVDTKHYQPGIVAPRPLGAQTLVFTGKMDFRPNVDAVLWFGTAVLPIIRQKVPQTQFYVVGKNPHPRLAPLRGIPGITLTGFVDDVRPYIAAATVYVVPLLTGGGTRLKVLEAMSMGNAIVSTTLGCEGIHATPGRDIVLADEAADMAAQVVALLGDPARRQALGAAARVFVERHFDWHIVTASLDQLYEG
jgi:sugar transferase (PEP-CTERM/EpsH1 system associated)